MSSNHGWAKFWSREQHYCIDNSLRCTFQGKPWNAIIESCALRRKECSWKSLSVSGSIRWSTDRSWRAGQTKVRYSVERSGFCFKTSACSRCWHTGRPSAWDATWTSWSPQSIWISLRLPSLERSTKQMTLSTTNSTGGEWTMSSSSTGFKVSSERWANRAVIYTWPEALIHSLS